MVGPQLCPSVRESDLLGHLVLEIGKCPFAHQHKQLWGAGVWGLWQQKRRVHLANEQERVLRMDGERVGKGALFRNMAPTSKGEC